MAIATVNPATGELVESYEPYDESRCSTVLEAASRAQRDWAAQDLGMRADRLQGLAKELRARQDEYAALITLEMGKPISQALAEVEKCAACVDHYVECGEAYLRPTTVEMGVRFSGVRYLPLGVVLGVMPWNYPFWQALRFAIPTLLAGNGVVLKHASNVPGSALALEQLALAAGLPEGLFGTVLVEGGAVIPLIHDDRIAAVSLTGSESVGRRIGAEAGAALKPAVLELGGSDPFIVLADADMAAAAQAAATARTLNNGQSCIAAKRFLVDSSVYDDFIDATRAALAALKFGDPTDPETQLGPMARSDLRDELHGQVIDTVAGGARLVAGGTPPSGPGAFYPATLLIDAGPGMVGFDEELFGPAGVVARANGEDALIELANCSRYGLGSSIWSGDPQRALQLGERVCSGMVFVNDYVRSDPRIPFGGVKASGYGRELGHHGIHEFVNAQTVYAR
ncbi:NAD-dependent succinate-semialdehyde dehydrogenase [Mycobacterium sp. CVI_P3]|uniref:NAD-dependent succinate-semialdehyde dehydrogenase n=1 Tax=Mycobacterium pinniadriaticum TaxID=2994102 RepID=A0ABT3SKX2_9MYCO|nr:NAD-dependent succinate-semialdehyde dehydrogenase [Mycobacterium pinniadriaticum]MCX2933748.1 NAD-dependent succinate-semialdehyde dehydrogenase [Mycobacterium pinniadriaticum]MCX2940170.1 NAD-dependent succinate-semialdehyde dehydrogenase [Mycobacterium pinniadriaticum]